MAGNNVSRRTLVPTIAAGASVALLGAGAEAAPARNRKFAADCGPCKLWQGQSIAFDFFLPAAQRPSTAESQFRLVLQDLDGSVLVSHDFALKPGSGKEFLLEHLADGSVRFNGEVVNSGQTQLVVIAIIAILIGLLLPAVQKVRATSTSFVSGRDTTSEQNVNYILPFIEQDNVAAR